MPTYDLSSKVNDFLALAHEDDELVRAQAEQLLDELAPGVITLIAKMPSALRADAVIIIADTRHSVGAGVEDVRNREVGDHFAQPRRERRL